VIFYLQSRISQNNAFFKNGSTSFCVKQALKKDAAFMCAMLFSAEINVRNFSRPAAQVKQK